MRHAGFRWLNATALSGEAGAQKAWRQYPYQATSTSPRCAEQRQESRVLNQTRQGTEPIIRRLKILRGLKDVERRRRRFALRVQRTAALCTLTQACHS
ncbi:hypothetical protein E7T06_14090 [Deinococcus sp. Arct2-2]|nr:hypothetical protein E7T06_14090 [Deinococcus sp. Arct2-2]